MSGRVEVNGTVLNTRVDGEPGAPWIVLSNSLAATLHMWEPQMALLTPRFRVLRYDTRGHGRSDAPPGDYAFDDLVADVVGLMDHFGIERAAYMGLSLGGMTGLGHELRVSQELFRMDQTIAWTAVLVLFVVASNQLLSLLERRYLAYRTSDGVRNDVV